MTGMIKTKPSQEEISCTKSILKEFMFMKGVTEDFEEREPELVERLKDGSFTADRLDSTTIRRINVYVEYRKLVNLIEQAHSAITDRDTQRMIEIRFFQGYTRAKTSAYFSGKYSDRTLDRRMIKGYETMAGCLKDWGLFETFKHLLHKPLSE